MIAPYGFAVCEPSLVTSAVSLLGAVTVEMKGQVLEAGAKPASPAHIRDLVAVAEATLTVDVFASSTVQTAAELDGMRLLATAQPSAGQFGKQRIHFWNSTRCFRS